MSDKNVTGKELFEAAGAAGSSIAGAVAAAGAVTVLAASAPVVATVIVIPAVAMGGYLGYKSGEKNPAGGLVKLLGVFGTS
jgi:hypothetical protein